MGVAIETATRNRLVEAGKLVRNLSDTASKVHHVVVGRARAHKKSWGTGCGVVKGGVKGRESGLVRERRKTACEGEEFLVARRAAKKRAVFVFWGNGVCGSRRKKKLLMKSV